MLRRYRQRPILRTQLHKLIVRAGLKPWLKLFQNLRSRRQTELAQEFSAHVVCSWIANSVAVAREHYLRVTVVDFERATKPCAPRVQSLQNWPGVEETIDPSQFPEVSSSPEVTTQDGSNYHVPNGHCWTRTSDPHRVRMVL